jgi:hypothetical protein
MRDFRSTTLAFLFSLATGAGFAAPAPLAEWHFNRAGILESWQPNGYLTDVVVTNGALSCRAIGADPILEYRPLLDLKASPWQAVEIRQKADRDGMAELFWSNTSTGRYGGFTQAKSTRFGVRGDSEWHTYRLLPFWHAEGKIVRLRFDVYDAARFELAFLRVIGFASGPPVDLSHERSFADWQWFEPIGEQEIAPLPGEGVVKQRGPGELLSPPLSIDASRSEFVSLRMAVDRGRRGTLFYAADTRSGLHRLSFPIEADGREHTCNLDLRQSTDWRGRILAIGLQPSDDTNAVATLRHIRVTDAP